MRVSFLAALALAAGCTARENAPETAPGSATDPTPAATEPQDPSADDLLAADLCNLNVQQPHKLDTVLLTSDEGGLEADVALCVGPQDDVQWAILGRDVFNAGDADAAYLVARGPAGKSVIVEGLENFDLDVTADGEVVVPIPHGAGVLDESSQALVLDTLDPCDEVDVRALVTMTDGTYLQTDYTSLAIDAEGRAHVGPTEPCVVPSEPNLSSLADGFGGPG